MSGGMKEAADYATVIEWFTKARDRAKASGKYESAALWDDGVLHT